MLDADQYHRYFSRKVQHRLVFSPSVAAHRRLQPPSSSHGPLWQGD